MYYVISIIILVASIMLILAVLVQNSKGGGLAANFASPNPTMGVRRTADFLEKSTWTLARLTSSAEIPQKDAAFNTRKAAFFFGC